MKVKYFNTSEPKSYSLRESIISEMEYHPSAGDGDRHYIDVIYKTGEHKRIFDIQEILFLKENK